MTEMLEVPGGPSEPPTEPKRLRFPTAFTVLAAVLLVVWGLSFVIPSGAYQVDPETGGPKPGTYAQIHVDKSLPHQFYKLWNSPTNGLYGVQNDKGNVSVDNSGSLYGAAQIFLFVLAIGAFISVTMKTGAIQTGIGRLALRFRHSPSLLIVVLMSVFALAGTTEGMAEESLGFFVLLVPLALGLGFDRMTGAGIVFLGCGSGVLASTVNPFATGVASDAAGIGVGDGIGLRVAMFIVIVGAAVGYVLRYAHRVRADSSRSVLGAEGMTSGGLKMADEAAGEVEPLTPRQKSVLVIFASAFVILIYGFVPWGDIWDTVFNANFPLPTFTSFYFAQATVMFLVLLILNLPIAFLVPSSSGHAALVMPILAPLSDFASVPRSIAVTGYQSASGLVNLITPTSAVVMGGIALSRIRYDQFLRFMLPFFGIALVLSVAFVAVGAALA